MAFGKEFSLAFGMRIQIVIYKAGSVARLKVLLTQEVPQNLCLGLCASTHMGLALELDLTLEDSKASLGILWCTFAPPWEAGMHCA